MRTSVSQAQWSDADMGDPWDTPAGTSKPSEVVLMVWSDYNPKTHTSPNEEDVSRFLPRCTDLLHCRIPKPDDAGDEYRFW